MATRNLKGQRERDMAQAALDAEAAELRAQRKTYPQIAAIQGCSVSTAYDRVWRAIDSVPFEAVDKLRRLELESLDELEQRCREVLLARHVKVDHGNVIMIEGEALLDDAPVLHAVAHILRIKDMRAKLTGEYAPTKSAVTVITEDAVDAEIRRLEEELGANATDTGDHRGATRKAKATRRASAPS